MALVLSVLAGTLFCVQRKEKVMAWDEARSMPGTLPQFFLTLTT